MVSHPGYEASVGGVVGWVPDLAGGFVSVVVMGLLLAVVDAPAR